MIDVKDGNDIDELHAAFEEAKRVKGKPTVLIANTVKGKGSSIMENKANWHHKVPTQEELDAFQEKVKRAETEAGKWSEKAGRMKGEYEAKESSIKDEISALFGEFSFEDAQTILKECLSENTTLTQVLTQNMTEVQKRIDRKQAIAACRRPPSCRSACPACRCRCR